MERLFFLCPNTRRTVDVGVETDIDTLLRIRTNKVRAECPACGRVHEWTVRDAALPQATEFSLTLLARDLRHRGGSTEHGKHH